nr:MAG TPA: hypothetical protein [Caudoviricetes sp.]
MSAYKERNNLLQIIRHQISHKISYALRLF